MEKRLVLKRESIQAIDLWESISASISDKHVTVFRIHRLGEEEKTDMIMLSLEEAKELAKFLEENL